MFSIFIYATIALICYIVNKEFADGWGKRERLAMLVAGAFSLASTAKNIWLVAGA